MQAAPRFGTPQATVTTHGGAPFLQGHLRYAPTKPAWNRGACHATTGRLTESLTATFDSVGIWRIPPESWAAATLNGTSANPTTNFTKPLGNALGDAVLIGIAVCAVAANVLNIYGGAMSFLTLGIRLPLPGTRVLRHAQAVLESAVRDGRRDRGLDPLLGSGPSDPARLLPQALPPDRRPQLLRRLHHRRNPLPRPQHKRPTQLDLQVDRRRQDLASDRWGREGVHQSGRLGRRTRGRPQHPTTVYASIGRTLLRTTDAGASWQPITQGLPQQVVTALTVDPRQSGTVYAGLGSTYKGRVISAMGGIYKTTNRGDTWTQALSGRTAGTLAVDPARPTTIYAAVHGRKERVARSTDAGRTWTTAP